MPKPDAPPLSLIQRLPRFASGMVAGIALIVLVGWIFGLPVLASFVPGLRPMQPVTALTFLVAAAALYLACRGTSPWPRRLATAGAAMVLLAALSNLLAYFPGLDFGFGLLFGQEADRPHRMTPHTTAAFVSAASALLLRQVETRGGFRPAPYFAAAAGFAALLELADYLYRISLLYAIDVHTGMSLPTILAFLALSLGLLEADPGRGLLASARSPGAGGLMLRRLLPTAVALPVGLGWLSFLGQRAGLYDIPAGAALMVTSTVLLLGALIWRNAGLLDRLDRDLREANASLERRVEERTAALRESEERLAGIVSSAMDAIVSTDEAQVIRLFNPAAEKMFGLSAAEAIGQSLACLMPGRLCQAHEDSVRRFASTGVTTRRMGALGETRGVRADGEAFPVEVSISQVPSAGGKLFTAIVRDITERKRDEDALRESEERFRLLAELSPDAILVHVDGRYTYANPAATRLLGAKDTQAIIGYPVYEVIPPESHALVAERVRRMLEENLAVPLIEYHWRRLDGSLVDVEVSAGPILWRGRPAIQVMARDITTRKRAEAALRQSEERFRAIFEHAGIGIAITDWEGRFQQCNPAYCELLGYRVEELRGGRFSQLIHPDDQAANLAEIQRLQNQDVPHFEIENRYLRKSGEPVWVRKFVSLVPDATGRRAHIVALVTDMSEHRRMEQALRDADRRKDEFLAILAHELRNPLAPIRNGLYLLRMAGGQDAAAGQIYGMMERQVNHLIRLVDDLMEVSRITRGKIELRKDRTDLAEIIGNAVETSQPLIDAARHAMKISLPSCPLPVDADPVRLAQVFANLLNNAAKYTESGGHLELFAERRDGEAVVSVRDDGGGIPAEMLPCVFDLFAQVDRSLGRAKGGLGIGLALVRSLVEMHGGRVEARSAGVGRGSEFIVRLPLADAPPAESAPPDTAAAAAGIPRRVLVVDDNRDAADSLGRLLECLGATARVVYDGQSALAALADFKPDVVLLDLGMPAMDGYETARRARQGLGGEAVTLVALTGWGQDEDHRRTHEAGFDRHLVKPVGLDQLQTILSNPKTAPA